MTYSLRPLLLLLSVVTIGGCGPTKYRLVSPADYPSARDRPCVHRGGVDAWQPGHRTQHQCAAWTDRTEFDIIDTEWTYFPHFLIGSSARSGRACPECWLEVVRPPREQPEAAWTLRLHVPPEDAVVATYTGGYSDASFQGQGSFSLVREDACTGYCLDFFVAEGELANTIVIQGEWEQGFLHDEQAFQAEWTLDNGGTYVGEAVYDPIEGLVPHGSGTRQSADGTVYTGELQHGARQGEGETHTVDGTVYMGGYDDDLPSGQGVLTEPSGARYEGAFVDGRRHGEGAQIFPDGSSYLGMWVNGLQEGEGVLTDANGITWQGVWEDGVLLEGEATLVWPDGQQYRGRIDGQSPHGVGVMEWPSGERYSGSWKRGRMAGLGQLRWDDGVTYTGTWREGRPSGCGLHREPDDVAFVGTWVNGAPAEASCAKPVPSLSEEELEVLGDDSLTASALSAALRAQGRTRSSREAAQEQLEALRSRYVSVLPERPGLDEAESEGASSGADDAEAPPELRTVRVAFAWPGDHHQRMVHPSCLDGEALQVTVDEASASFVLGGIVDAEVALALSPGSTPMVCAEVTGACGQGRGCVATDVPADPPLPEEESSSPLRLRILLEPLPEVEEVQESPPSPGDAPEEDEL